ncbi:MAG: DNA polymerase III subunit alpha, partial [Spirochaetales bacterium]|nr:DNA polymerase III subunit alpha [Spirochaetales bacterium]
MSKENNNFVNLHNYTEYSMNGSIIRVNPTNKDNIAEYAKSRGMNAVAITDLGNMSGVIDFYKCCVNAGIKPIIGSEFYVAPNFRFDNNAPTENSRLVLLAKNENGYKNLMKLSSVSYSEGFCNVARIDKELLRKYSSDLVCLSAGLDGVISRLILADRLNEAIEEAMFYKELFGGDSFFLELQNHNLTEDKKCITALVKMSKDLNIPVVAANSCYCLRRSDAPIQDIWSCILTRKNITNIDRIKLPNDEYYFKSAQEMSSIFKEVPNAISNTVAIAEMCDVRLNLHEPVSPDFLISDEVIDIHDGSADRDELYLRKLTQEGIIRRYGENPSDEVWSRMNDELNTICQQHCQSYFLIIWDMVKFAKDNGIEVGPGRGTAAGSIVLFALGITNIDPLKYGLLFERFFNPEYVRIPDIDIDYCKERRGEVLEYIRQKYGTNHVSRIVTFGRMKAGQTLRDVGRVLDVPIETVNEIAALIPCCYSSLSDIINTEECRELNDIYKGRNSEKSNLIRTAMRLEGIVRVVGVHACGVVIGKEPITNYTPKMVVKDVKEGDTIVTQYPGSQLEECGLVKMDFLGLITLTMQRNCLALIKKTEGKDIDLDHLDLDDQFVYKHVFASGDTMGIFQFD